MGVTLRKAVPEDFPEAGRILWAAFGRKLRPFLGADAARASVLLADLFAARGITPESLRIAVGGEGIPLGVCALCLPGRRYGALLPTLRVSLRHLGLWGGLRAFVGLTFFEERPRPGVCLITLLAVAPEARGRGIGGALLAHAEAEARRDGLARLALDVIENNPARRLYERHGFRVTQVHRVPAPLTNLFGFSGFDHMEKRLT